MIEYDFRLFAHFHLTTSGILALNEGDLLMALHIWPGYIVSLIVKCGDFNLNTVALNGFNIRMR